MWLMDKHLPGGILTIEANGALQLILQLFYRIAAYVLTCTAYPPSKTSGNAVPRLLWYVFPCREHPGLDIALLSTLGTVSGLLLPGLRSPSVGGQHSYHRLLAACELPSNDLQQEYLTKEPLLGQQPLSAYEQGPDIAQA